MSMLVGGERVPRYAHSLCNEVGIATVPRKPRREGLMDEAGMPQSTGRHISNFNLPENLRKREARHSFSE